MWVNIALLVYLKKGTEFLLYSPTEVFGHYLHGTVSMTCTRYSIRRVGSNPTEALLRSMTDEDTCKKLLAILEYPEETSGRMKLDPRLQQRMNAQPQSGLLCLPWLQKEVQDIYTLCSGRAKGLLQIMAINCQPPFFLLHV